jgi:hypothetical protein
MDNVETMRKGNDEIYPVGSYVGYFVRRLYILYILSGFSFEIIGASNVYRGRR